jgi:hypothetical protein
MQIIVIFCFRYFPFQLFIVIFFIVITMKQLSYTLRRKHNTVIVVALFISLSLLLLPIFTVPAKAQFSSRLGDVVRLQGQTFTLAEIILMSSLANSDIQFSNCTIVTDSTTTDPVREAAWRAQLMNINSRNGKVVLDVRVEFDSCRLPALKFINFVFEKGIIFNSCTIDEYLGFQMCEMQSLGISKTTIATNVEVEGLVNFELDRSVLGSCVFASNVVNSVNFERTEFTQLAQVFAPFSNPLNEFVLQNCTLGSTATMQLAGHIRTCRLEGDTVRGTMSVEATILTALVIEGCVFEGAIAYEAFNTPERATTLRWSQFAGYKLTVRDTVNGRTVTELDDYEALLKTYSFFYNVYSKNWQDESKNDCYVEMKTMQTRWLGIQHQNEHSFTSLLVWQLNLFLERFCKYGTEPVMAIQYSLWVLGVFALLYFVFPSQPEDINGLRFTHTFYNLASHRDERMQQIEKISSEIHALEESHHAAPVLIRRIGTPFFYGHIMQYTVRLWVVEQSDGFQRLQQRWDMEHPKSTHFSRTQLLGTAGAYLFGLLIIAGFARAVNALALSLNAFVTLGYGEIQARGLARYLAVLEGAMGWFLLSIFSVSLISQILQ